MKVRVRMFAMARQLVGADQIDVELPEDATVRELVREFIITISSLRSPAPQLPDCDRYKIRERGDTRLAGK